MLRQSCKICIAIYLYMFKAKGANTARLSFNQIDFDSLCVLFNFRKIISILLIYTLIKFLNH